MEFQKGIQIKKWGLLARMVFYSCLFLSGGLAENNSEKDSWKKIEKLEKSYENGEASLGVDLTQKENFTLSNVLKQAYIQSPALKASFYEWKAALNKLPMSGSLEDPQFSYVYFLKSVETRVGPQRQRFTLMQAFPWFGVLSLKEDIAFAESELKRVQFERKWLALSQNIKRVFAEYYLLGKKIDILKDKFSLLESLHSAASAQYSAGGAIYKKILMLQVEMGKLENDIESLTLARGPLNDELANLMHTPLEGLFPFPDSLDQAFGQLPEKEKLWEKIKKNNPNLSELSHKLKGFQLEERLLKKSYYPNFKLGVDWVQTDKSPMDVNDNGKDPLMLMATVNIPLQLSSKSHGVKMAQAKQKAVHYMNVNMESELKTALSKILFKYEDTVRKSELYKQSLIPIAEQSLWVLQTEFKTGDASFLEMIEGERELLKFEFEYQESLKNLVLYWAELEYLTGESL